MSFQTFTDDWPLTSMYISWIGLQTHTCFSWLWCFAISLMGSVKNISTSGFIWKYQQIVVNVNKNKVYLWKSYCTLSKQCHLRTSIIMALWNDIWTQHSESCVWQETSCYSSWATHFRFPPLSADTLPHLFVIQISITTH